MKKIEKLILSARQAIQFAYAPYSQFKVGAAILTKQGKIFSGANIENASYGLTICAERIALYKAISEGARHITTIAIYTNTNDFTAPCGACCQTLAEFNPNVYIILINKNGALKQLSLTELLPFPFLKKSLK